MIVLLIVALVENTDAWEPFYGLYYYVFCDIIVCLCFMSVILPGECMSVRISVCVCVRYFPRGLRVLQLTTRAYNLRAENTPAK